MKHLSLLAALSAALVLSPAAYAAKCTGDLNCRACTNCKYCKHCSQEGGKCGVCAGPAPGNSNQTTRRTFSETPRATTRTRPRPSASLSPFSGKVVAVTDGDTLKVMYQGRAVTIRLHGIDAPEKRQPFGENSKRSLSSLTFGKVAQVYPTTMDRYGRIVANVVVNRADINATQVNRGMAWWYQGYAPGSTRLARLQSSAKARRKGLWFQARPTAPWEWRRAN